jgi:hypothetical protein
MLRADAWARARAEAERLLLRAGPPDEPRDESGKWTSGGSGSGSAEAAPAAPAEPKLEPAVIQVGGDEWNKATARRLEREYQSEAKPALDKLAEQATGKTVETPPSEDDEDYEPPFVPEEWDMLSNVQQEEAKEKYVSQNLESYMQSEVDNWYDNGDALDDAKSAIAWEFNEGKNTDWANEAITGYRDESDERIPFTNEQLINALHLEYNAGYSGAGKLDIDFDDKELQEPSNLPPPGQGTLPGIEPSKPEEQLTQDMRDGLEKAINKAFDKEGDDKQGSMDPPEYLNESAQEFVGEDWDSNMSDKEKFKWVKNNTDIVEEASTEGSGSEPQAFTVDALPKHFDPLNEGDSDDVDYKRTQALARVLSIERTAEVLKARGLPVPSKGTLEDIDARLWRGWKQSSTGQSGRLLQIATADELGGRLLEKTAVDLDPAGTRQYADLSYKEIGGYAGVKAYVRAKWETTQYLLDKAGIHNLKLYRGIELDKEKIDKLFELRAMQSAKEVEGYKFLPALQVDRNGAASTSINPAVSNDWKPARNRIVLRAEVPRTAAISVPAYGINMQNEREVVVAGTAWKGWDAWKETAPPFEYIPLQQAA